MIKTGSSMTLSQNLSKLMKQKEFSLKSLSEKSGVAKSTIHGWAIGRKVRDLTELKKVAEILKVSLHSLVFGEPDPYESISPEVLSEIFSGDVRVSIHRIERRKK